MQISESLILCPRREACVAFLRKNIIETLADFGFFTDGGSRLYADFQESDYSSAVSSFFLSVD
jgi:hypothetical protein